MRYFLIFSTGENFTQNSASPTASTSDSCIMRRAKISPLQEQILLQITEIRKERSHYYKEKLKLLKQKEAREEMKLSILQKIENKLGE